jgi:hypothetical protein
MLFWATLLSYNLWCYYLHLGNGLQWRALLIFRCVSMPLFLLQFYDFYCNQNMLVSILQSQRGRSVISKFDLSSAVLQALSKYVLQVANIYVRHKASERPKVHQVGAVLRTCIMMQVEYDRQYWSVLYITCVWIFCAWRRWKQWLPVSVSAVAAVADCELNQRFMNHVIVCFVQISS